MHPIVDLTRKEIEEVRVWLRNYWPQQPPFKPVADALCDMAIRALPADVGKAGEVVAWRWRQFSLTYDRWGDWHHVEHEPRGPASNTFQVEPLYAAPAALPEGYVMAKFIDPNSAAFGNGTEYEERLIAAGTRYITQTIGHYSTGDRRFTMGLFNALLAAALPEGYVRVPKEIFDGALNYIQHVGANQVMRGEPHPQQWLVDGLLAAAQGERK